MGVKWKFKAPMLLQPGLHGRGLVGGVVVHDQMHVETLGCVALNDPEEAQELLGPMPRQALADHLAGLHIQGGEQGRGAMALVVVRHGSGAALLHGQSWLRAIQRLDLALLVDAQHQRLVGRVEVEDDHIGNLVGEFGIAGEFETARQMRSDAA